MPKMRNISQRVFVISGKTLKQGETSDFAQSVIDRHVSMYPMELEAVAGDIDVAIKKETHTTTLEENAPTPKRRGRKPKAKE